MTTEPPVSESHLVLALAARNRTALADRAVANEQVP